MNQAVTTDATMIQQWIAEKMRPDAIEPQLAAKGFDKETIAAYISEYKRISHSKKLSKGFFCAALGAFLGFVSCVLTIINPVPELYNVILFGLTSVAVLLICLGLYFVFE